MCSVHNCMTQKVFRKLHQLIIQTKITEVALEDRIYVCELIPGQGTCENMLSIILSLLSFASTFCGKTRQL